MSEISDEAKASVKRLRDAVAAKRNSKSDTELLDWLEAQSNGSSWTARQSATGRGYRLYNDAHGEHATAREAIRAAMEQAESAGKSG